MKQELAALEEEKRKLVELHFFNGLPPLEGGPGVRDERKQFLPLRKGSPNSPGPQTGIIGQQ